MQIWAKPQPAGAIAMYILHSGVDETPTNVTVELGRVPWYDARQSYLVRDVYARADLGTARGASYALRPLLAPRSSRMLLFTPVHDQLQREPSHLMKLTADPKAW